MTDDTDKPSEDRDEDVEVDAPMGVVIPFSRTMTAKARRAVRSLGFGGRPTV